MRAISFALPAMVLFAIAASAAAAPAPQPKPVHGQGCVEAGVEAGCLVTKDIRSGIVYNLLFKDTHPNAGMGIDFTGVEHEGVTMCMQGVAVNVTAWRHVESLKCSPGRSAKP